MFVFGPFKGFNQLLCSNGQKVVELWSRVRVRLFLYHLLVLATKSHLLLGVPSRLAPALRGAFVRGPSPLQGTHFGIYNLKS